MLANAIEGSRTVIRKGRMSASLKMAPSFFSPWSISACERRLSLPVSARRRCARRRRMLACDWVNESVSTYYLSLSRLLRTVSGMTKMRKMVVKPTIQRSSYIVQRQPLA